MDERASSRVVTEAMVECRTAEECLRASLCNLSADGCMVRLMAPGLEGADEVEVRFDLGITVAGRVIWRQGSYAGVRFSQQLHQAAVRHLDVAKFGHRTWFELPNLPHPLQGVSLE